MNRLSFERLRLRSDLWHDRGFVKLWAANGISQLGTQVTLLALPLTALYVLNASTLAVALLRSFAVLPFLLFSLPAGVWIDRVRRRPLMIVADFGRAIAIVSIPVAYWFGHLSMTQLYVVVAIHGLLSVVFDVSYLSFLPTLVGRPQLGEANAKLLGTQSLAQLIGPTLAGSLVAAFGAPVAVFADAVSFGVSGGFVSAIRGREPKPEPSHARARTELVEGLRYVFSQPYLRTLTIWFSVGNLFSSAIFALIVVYFVRDLHLGAASIGWVLAVINVGFIAGAFANRPLVERFGIGRMIAYPALLSPIALMTIPAAPAANPYPVLILGGVAGTFIALLREREPADAPAVDHAAPPARPDELGGAVHVLGHDPARVGARRSRRREHRAADDAVRRGRLLRPRGDPDRALADPEAPRPAGAAAGAGHLGRAARAGARGRGRRMSPRGGDLLRHRDFQKLWAGQTVSQLGSQVSQLALPLVAVLVLHVSAFYVALLGTVDLLPFLLFALPAGVWIDRIPRRPVLIVADTGRALALATVPIVAAFGNLTIWQLYAVGFVTGTFTVFFDVAYQSYLPSLVGRPHLVEGNAKLELSRSAAQIAGPGVGGVLVGAITAPYAVVVDSVSFAVSALFLGRIRKREPRPEPTAAPSMRARIDGGPALRARRPALARDHAVRLDVQLLHERRLRAVRRLRRQEPRAHAGRARPRLRAREPRLAARRRRRPPLERPARHRQHDRARRRSSAARRRCSSRSRRRASRFRSSSRPA